MGWHHWNYQYVYITSLIYSSPADLAVALGYLEMRRMTSSVSFPNSPMPLPDYIRFKDLQLWPANSLVCVCVCGGGGVSCNFFSSLHKYALWTMQTLEPVGLVKAPRGSRVCTVVLISNAPISINGSLSSDVKARAEQIYIITLLNSPPPPQHAKSPTTPIRAVWIIVMVQLYEDHQN